MQDVVRNVTRRTFFGAGGLGVLAAAGWSASVDAAEWTVNEKANVQLVNEFCKLWEVRAPDPEQLGSFFTDDCVVILTDSALPTVGRAAVVDRLKGYFVPGRVFELKILDAYANGPVVVHTRADRVITPARSSDPNTLVGLYVFKDKKLQFWADYDFPQ